jgi:DNA primase
LITQKTIQEIIETAKVEDVVGDFVNLKRRGVNMIGLCPFHNEKTPSFTVSPAKNIYKCFGCGKGGDPIRFLMDQENYSYPEALRSLAAKYSIEVQETKMSDEAKEERKKVDDLYALNQYASEYFIDQMWNTDYGKSIGLSYFKRRGFREETLKKWGLGYAPDKKDHFVLGAVNDGYQKEQLQSIGLATQYGRDFFRGRVMFPIRNISGKIIGFGGRVLAKDAKTAKYMNSPDSEVYNKSKVLYGAHFARTAIRKADECMVVEGYTDTLAMHQSGIENVVAPCGTSLTPGQIHVIKRYTPNITFIFDGDAAGKKAALRGLDMVLELDMNVRLVLLPEGEDPDSLLQGLGTTKFEEYIERNKKDFILFKTEHLLEESKGDPIKKATLIKEIIASIAKIPDPIKRSVYIKEVAEMTGTGEHIFFAEIKKAITKLIEERNKKRKISNLPNPSSSSKNKPNFSNENSNSDHGFSNHGFAPDFPTETPPNSGTGFPEENLNDVFQGNNFPPSADFQEYSPNTPKKEKRENKRLGDEFQEQDIVRILIEAGAAIMYEDKKTTVSEFILENIKDLLNDFDNAYYAKIVEEAFIKFTEGEILSSQYFMNHKDEKIRDITIGLLTSPFDYSHNWIDKHDLPLQNQKSYEENFAQDTVDSVNRFKLRKVIKILKDNQEKLKTTKDSTEMIKILKVQQKLTEMKVELAAYFGSVIVK